MKSLSCVVQFFSPISLNIFPIGNNIQDIFPNCSHNNVDYYEYDKYNGYNKVNKRAMTFKCRLDNIKIKDDFDKNDYQNHLIFKSVQNFYIKSWLSNIGNIVICQYIRSDQYNRILVNIQNPINKKYLTHDLIEEYPLIFERYY